MSLNETVADELFSMAKEQNATLREIAKSLEKISDVLEANHAKRQDTRPPVKNSYRFFQNTDCEYFPCHKTADTENFSCLFCYCPLYHMKDCPGKPNILPNGIKDCTNCILPHTDYDKVIKTLKETQE